MANYAALKATIDADIRSNGEQLITGPVLNGVLTNILAVMGQAGFLFKGMAHPGDTPAASDSNLFYLAVEAGQYSGFDGRTVTAGQLVIFAWDGAWASDVLLDISGKANKNGDPAEAFTVFTLTAISNIVGAAVTGETVGADKVILHNPDNNAMTDLVPGGQSQDIEVVMPSKDGTLALQEDVDAAVSQLGQKVSELPLQLFDGIVNGSGVWQLGSNKQHFLIPVSGGESVLYDAPSDYMYCAFLKSYTTPIAGGTPDFCTGYEGRQGRNEANAFYLPSDCRYFVINIAEDTYIPTKLQINGIDIVNGAYGGIFDIGDSIKAINTTLMAFSYTQLGGVCAGTGASSIDRVINYDSSTQEITIPQDVILLFKSLGDTTDYKITSATTLDVSPTAISTSAIIIFYDKSDDAIKASGYSTRLSTSQYFIAGFRRSTNAAYCSFVTPFPWAIDKVPYGLNDKDLVMRSVTLAGVPAITGKYVDYDTTAGTLTIPRNIVIKGKNIGNNNENYLATTSDTVISVPSSTSALTLVYDKADGQFKFISYSSNFADTQYYILGLRSNLGTAIPAIASVLPWSIDGNPYNIKINNYERRRAFVKGVNHQGYNRVAPANTLPAFQLSAKQGFKYVETDVRFTSDGVAVLLHDESINATARNADGSQISETINIADITYEQALTYDFGIWKGEQYAGTKIPTLEEFIILCRNLGLSPYVEVKIGTQQQIDGLFAIVAKYGMLRHTTWITAGETYLDRIVASPYPKYRIGYVIVPIDISDAIITKVLSVQNAAEEVFVDGNVNMLTSAGIDKCKNNGIPLEVFTINRSNISLADNDYYSGFTSDEIDMSLIRYENNQP